MDEPTIAELISKLQELDSSDFEQFVADLWTLQDWKTVVTPSSRDRGMDIIATREFPFPQKTIIQAKRYGSRSRVSSPEIQKYASLKQRDGVDTVVVVTTSEFTPDAYQIADDFNIKCVNGENLARFTLELGATEILMNYADDESLLPMVERPNRNGELSLNGDDRTTPVLTVGDVRGDQETVVGRANNLTMELVAIAEGEALNHYLNKDIKEIEEGMIMEERFEGRETYFIKVTNDGGRHEGKSRNFWFENAAGHEYSRASDSIVGKTGVYLRYPWKSVYWDISHGQTQYWAVITEQIPESIEIDKIVYSIDDKKIVLEFGEHRNRLIESDALEYSS